MSDSEDGSAHWTSRAHHFVTVDAETCHIPEGIDAVCAVRERVEAEQGMEIPITWFIRFQRTWDEYVQIDAADYFSGPITKAFDGFELGKPQLLRLRKRGDEIGWHYHAYSYVHRDDLSHEKKVAILGADLAACGAEIRRRYREFEIQSFRWGWFFVPDYSLFAVLNDVGVRIDASIMPQLAGRKVQKFNVTHPVSITDEPRKIGGTWFVPFARTSLIHDYNMVSHDLGWSAQDEQQATQSREALETRLSAIANELGAVEGAFLTYEKALARENAFAADRV